MKDERMKKKNTIFILYMLFQCFLNKVIKTEDKHGQEVCTSHISNCQIIYCHHAVRTISMYMYHRFSTNL